MEPEGPLQHSQGPATCPKPEPDWSSPYSSIPLPLVLFHFVAVNEFHFLMAVLYNIFDFSNKHKNIFCKLFLWFAYDM